jgi:hypothetical protein
MEGAPVSVSCYAHGLKTTAWNRTEVASLTAVAPFLRGRVPRRAA